MSDRLTDALRRVDELSGGTPPTGLIARARDESDSLGQRRRLRNLRHVAVATVAIAVTFTTAFTPPGRAATGWLADLAGFGEEPSLEQAGSVPGSAVVIASGQLSDGTPYEVVAKRVLFGVGPDTRQKNDNRPAVLCFQVDFPQRLEKGQGGHCTDGEENGRGLGNESTSLHQEPTKDGGSTIDKDGPGVFLGLVEIPEAASITVFETREGDSPQPMPSQLIEVKGDLLAETGTETPVGVFVAPIDGETVQAGRRGELEVRAVAYASDGEALGHDDLLFPPICPPAPEPVSAPPAGTPRPRPASPDEIEAIRADPCALIRAASPPPVSENQLSREPVPLDLSSVAEAAGHPIEPAPAADYDPLFEPGYDASTVDQAVHDVAREVRQRIEAAKTHGWISHAQIYLALATDEERLVYVVRYDVTRYASDRPPAEPSPELPQGFIALFDVLTGDRLWLTAERLADP